MLRGEVAPLLERFDKEMAKQGIRPNFSLRAEIGGENPFLMFYLRDVPSANVSKFQLRLTGGEHGNLAYVNVAANSIDVSARTPSTLVESASRYLAFPRFWPDEVDCVSELLLMTGSKESRTLSAVLSPG